MLYCQPEAGVRRRDFIKAIGLSVAWPMPLAAQEAGRTYRVGILNPVATFWPILREEFRRSGFIDGQNLVTEGRVYGLQVERIAEMAADLVKQQPDVVVAGGDFAIRALQKVTSTIPIVGLTDDMLGAGFVDSLARPSTNTTGVSLLANELDGKRQDILIEAVPGLRRMAAFADAGTTSAQQLQALQDAARKRGIELSIHRVNSAAEIAAALDAAKAANVGALNILASPLLFANQKLIIERSAALRLPAIYQWPEAAEQGGLIGYGPRLEQLWREIMAGHVVKILRGAKPAEIPVQLPTKFELVINLQTAKALGDEIPAGLVLRADKLIE
jgi:putative ABC transport system substrate-binding protein